MFGLIFGFLTSFLPKGIEFFERRDDRKHELEMYQLQTARGNIEAEWRADEARTSAEMEALKGAYQFASQPVGYRWVEAFIGLVRPNITYAYMGLYAMSKIARFSLATSATGDWRMAATVIWDAADMEVFGGVIGFWFGLRHQTKKI
jgi:hypothetical protein